MTTQIRAVVGGNDYGTEQWRTTLTLASNFNVGSVSPTELAAISQQIRDTFNTHVWQRGVGPGLRNSNAVSTTLDYASCRVYSNPFTAPIGFHESNYAAVPGAGPSGILPGSSAVVATKRTELATRAGRGRAYLPLTGLGLEAASGQIPDAQVVQYATWYAAWLTALNATNFVLGGVAYGFNAVVSGAWAPSLFGYEITNISVDSRVDRQVGRQRNAPSQSSSTIAV